MGVVYRVQHLILDRQFALKLLAPEQINNLSWRRFELEGRSLAKLNHANIVSIYNMGVDRGCPYFVMDWLDGISLAERIDESGPLTERESLEIFLQVCSGLSCAHANGIIHRDIKPANIMLIGKGKDTKVKIVDFGIARLQSQNANSMQALTKNGEVFGSPLYMSPEQSRGEEIDERSDLYSVGCSLFETLTGKPPFRGASAIATLMMHQEAASPGLSSVSSANIFNPSLDVLMAL
jgi:serine/threonine protein kinase